MYDDNALNDLHNELEARLTQASREGRFLDVAQIAGALDKLKAWRASNQTSDLPGEVTVLPDLDVQRYLRPASETSPVIEPASSMVHQPSSAPPASTNTETVDPAFSLALAEIRREIDLGQFIQAESRLDVLAGQITNHAEQSELDETQRRFRERRRAALDEALRNARTSSGDALERRQRWQAVLDIEREHPEALDAMQALSVQQVDRHVISQVSSIRRDLPQIGLDITKVEEARRTVQSLLYDSTLRDPAVKQDIEGLLEEIDQKRAEIQRASEGGTSSERSGQFEKAFDVYRDAVMKGYKVIVDDETGEEIVVEEAYQRATKGFFAVQVERSQGRYVEAESALHEGRPEVAVARLNEALALLERVTDTAGSELRQQIEQRLETANQQAADKEEAEKLVLEAEQERDPRQARSIFLRARERFEQYPQIDAYIQNAESLIVRAEVNDLRTILSRADALLDARDFEAARQACEDALRIGQELDFAQADDEYKQLHARAETLLDEIGKAQNRWRKLQERTDAIRVALDNNNPLLAKRLIDDLSPEEAVDPSVTALGYELAQLGDDNTKIEAAERAFSGQDYEQVIKICADLQQSGMRERGAVLQRRAQARLWTQQASSAHSRGDRKAANGFYQQLFGLKGQLPADDMGYVEDAEKAIDRLASEERQSQNLTAELEQIHERRLMGEWIVWYQQLTALEQRAPEWFMPQLSKERSGGIEDWRVDAVADAERIVRSEHPDWQEAYSTLHSLYRIGAISDDDDLYRQVARNYQSIDATSYEKSDDPTDLEKAVELRREVYNAAEPPALAERAALAATIRKLVLLQATDAASSGGPHESVAILREHLDDGKNIELRRDPEVRQLLIRYALLARLFQEAEKEAQALRFLDLSEASLQWQQLIGAATLCYGAETTREAGARELVALRDSLAGHKADNGASPNGDEILKATVDEIAETFAIGLYSEIHNTAAVPSNEDILQRVGVYEMILQLHPNDRRALTGVEQLRGRLREIGKALADRARSSRSNQAQDPVEELKQLETLNHELSTVKKAFVTLNETHTSDAQELAHLQDRVQRQIQRLQDMQRHLEELQDAYRLAVSETWDAGPVRAALQGAQNANRQSRSVNQLSDWENRVVALDEKTEALKRLLSDIRNAWEAEEYERVVGACNDFENELSRARIELSGNHAGSLLPDLVVPSIRIALVDEHTGSRLMTVRDVREAARKKAVNLAAWQTWQHRYESRFAEAREASNSAEKDLSAKPPCLTRSEQHLKALVRHFQAILETIEDQPGEPFSDAAERCAESLQRTDMAELTKDQIAQTESRIAEVQKKLKAVDEPLNRLRRFFAGNPNLRRRGNERTFRGLVGAVERIDACHPELASIIERFERVTGKEY